MDGRQFLIQVLATLAILVGATPLAMRAAVAADFVNHLGMAFVTLPPGSLLVGDCRRSWAHCAATPRYPATFALPLQVQTTAVTNGQYNRFLAMRATPSPPWSPDRDAQPANGLTWVDAQDFIAWLNATKPDGDAGRYRLLTEAEWEYAERAGTATRYHWGNAARRRDCAACTGADPRGPAGAFPPNGFGLFDMQGYVREWVADCHHGGKSGPADGGLWREPQDPADCDRVIRGGYWYEVGGRGIVDATERRRAEPFYSAGFLGFRVARMPPDQPARVARTEPDPLPRRADYAPPPPLRAIDATRDPTAATIEAIIQEMLHSCRIDPEMASFEQLRGIVEKTRPVFRGLPVISYDEFGDTAQEAIFWGFGIAAPVQAVRAAIPEAKRPRKFLSDHVSGRASIEIDDQGDGQSRVGCRWYNPFIID